MKLTDYMNEMIRGHVHIIDKNTGEVLLNKKNAIHPQNMARVIARGLAGEDNSRIYRLALGNGGTHIDSSLVINYNTPNTNVVSAILHNETYDEVVDEDEIGAGVGNSVISTASEFPALTSIVTITMEIDSTEPNGQAPDDGVTATPDSDFFFDELGLFTSDGLLLSHIVFSPIEKTANRDILITYTLTISVS